MASDSYGEQIKVVSYTFVVLTTIATALRVYCRGILIRAFQADDWLAIISQLIFIVLCGYTIAGVSYGTGQHLVDIPESQIPKAMQAWWICEPLYVLTNMAIKASIAIFILRICVRKNHKIVIWTVLVVTEVYSLFFFLLFVLQCRPASLFWLRFEDSAPSGSCLDPTVIANAFYAYSAISCLIDWTYSVLPIFLVWKLQMNKNVKISVMVVLAAGIIASSATIVRLPYLLSLTELSDFLYSTANVATWSIVETGIGITAAAMATLRPLLRTVFGSGSSVPEQVTSARQWHRTDSERPKGDEVFDMPERMGQRIGVTTVIDVEFADQPNRGDNASEAAVSVEGTDDWNSSQSNLADKREETRSAHGWNLSIKKSIVQNRES